MKFYLILSFLFVNHFCISQGCENILPPSGLKTQIYTGQGKISDLYLSGENIKWYNSLKDNEVLQNNNELISKKIYFGTQTIGTCESKRVPVLVIKVSDSLQFNCGKISDLDFTIESGAKVNWYSDINSNTPLDPNTQLVSGSYYVSQTIYPVSTVAGGAYGYVNGKGTNAKFNYPQGIAIDTNSNLFLADVSNNCIRKIDPSGLVSTYAGFSSGYNDGPANQARFNLPKFLVLDKKGNLFVSEYGNQKIRKINKDGIVNTIYSNLRYPEEITIDNNENLIIDNFNVITIIDKNGIFMNSFFPLRAGGVEALAVDYQNNIFFGYNWWIIKVTPDLNQTIFTEGPSSNLCSIICPNHLLFDNDGNMIVIGNSTEQGIGVKVFKKIISTSNIQTLIKYQQGYKDGLLSEAQFGQIMGAAIDLFGNFYLTDGNRIRKIILMDQPLESNRVKINVNTENTENFTVSNVDIPFNYFANLNANGCTGGTIKWYNDIENNNLVQTGNQFITPLQTENKNYYVNCTKQGCTNTIKRISTINVCSQDVFTVKSGNWIDPSIWSCGFVPNSLNNVTISNNHIVEINNVHNLKSLVNNGTLNFISLSAYLIFDE